MNKIVTTLLIGGLTLGGFTMANASPGHFDKPGHASKSCGKHEMDRGSRIEKMIKHLDLDEGQAEQVRNIRDNYRPQMKELKEKMKDNRQQLHELAQADTLDQEQVKIIAEVIGDLITEKIILRTTMKSEIRMILSEEQREEMKNWKRDRGFGHGRRHHGRDTG